MSREKWNDGAWLGLESSMQELRDVTESALVLVSDAAEIIGEDKDVTICHLRRMLAVRYLLERAIKTIDEVEKHMDDFSEW